MQAMDRRARRSRQAIFSAFEGLLAEKRFGQITVSDIIERADVGRSRWGEPPPGGVDKTR